MLCKDSPHHPPPLNAFGPEATREPVRGRSGGWGGGGGGGGGGVGPGLGCLASCPASGWLAMGRRGGRGQLPKKPPFTGAPKVWTVLLLHS